ncbi:hypothetical protein HK100_006590 [Physocladia obscura]|uniref:Thioredoxin-dependent peroxiredoxin n=1 Tax=Physocladia obscura TaxID=109957 RepID=A0AAD5SS83_9FUNG|nr:hypothetical protein HK100_006590 [Physocladia obscura]
MAAPIKVGDKIPFGLTFTTSANATETGACAIPQVCILPIDTKMSDKLKEHITQPIKSEDALGKGKVILVAVPGAFTPTCHLQHLPGFIQHADAFKAKGISKIYVTSTNDIFVLDAWGKHEKAGDAVSFLADGNGAFAAAIGFSLDLSAKGMGAVRTKRYAIVVEDGVVTYVGEGDLDVSGAEAVLAKL